MPIDLTTTLGLHAPSDAGDFAADLVREAVQTNANLLDAEALLLRQAATYAGLQAGVYAAGDLMVTQRGAGANMSVDVAAGTAWIMSSASILLPKIKASVTNVAVTAAHASNPRVDQVVIDSAGTISVLAGTATGGATLDNRTGAASLPAGSLRLADILVAAASSTVSNTSIRDRRQFARGFFNSPVPTTSGPTIASGTFATIAEMSVKGNFSGVPVRVSFAGVFYNGTVNDELTVKVQVDGANPTGISDPGMLINMPIANNGVSVALNLVLPSTAAGFHTVTIAWARSNGSGTWNATQLKRQMVVEEIVRQNVASNSVTSG